MPSLTAQSRRDFLKKLAFLLASGGGIALLQSRSNAAPLASASRKRAIGRTIGNTAGLKVRAASKKKPGSGVPDSPDRKSVTASPRQPSYTLAPWKGDDFSTGHKMRDGLIPPLPKEVEKTVDFVIVGGGMAGLSTAYYLNSHDFLLLEQYAELGGQSRGSNYRGIGYSYGAAYISEPEGLMADLVSDLKLKPVKIGPEKNYWREGDSWLQGTEGDKGLYKDFRRLRQESEKIWKMLKYGQKLVPLDDIALQRLDSTPFSSCLTGYSANFMANMDALCKANNCAGINGLSALAGYMTLEDVEDLSYVFPGGNPALASAIAESVAKAGKDRCLTNTFVWSIEVKEEGASVVYSTKDGQMHRVNCKHVIVTAPPLVAARIMHGIDDQYKARLLSFKYGSYLVANLLLRKQVFKGAYDNWLTPPFTFLDITIAETPYQLDHTYKPEMGSVLTVYQPYEPSSPGRALLFMGDRQAFATSIVKQVGQLAGSNLERELESVVLSRWGHAMAVVGPNFFSKMSKIANTTPGAVSLAHCSTQGLACAESALLAAHQAANRALSIKEKAKAQVSTAGMIMRS